jgi:hypothetical protein
LRWLRYDLDAASTARPQAGFGNVRDGPSAVAVGKPLLARGKKKSAALQAVMG